ncbi:IclR family transcriptional regulator [Paracoccus sp. (in: a-proteobacteria)]|uniref:IclR family transcriptional regulator n=1 Tax=Paracoccus sp. TaxID=267 RepID=UPI0026DF1352|nr:IclR family transcriptional regulator [Paracoccus sp. (in: a-proteobacteria)]MDO5647243.1 IclR family transcriptional regulator [Paracoccus sp. (in: a-proteobacteria)]
MSQTLDDSDDTADRYRAPALDKGLDILEVLADQPRGLTRTEIVRALGLSASQMYRMLERLVARGYVARIEGDRYALTMRMFLLAHGHPPLRRLIAQAQPEMDHFARQQRQSCHLVVPEHGACVIVAQAGPVAHWEFRGRVGAELDLFDTASGRALLAFQDPDRLATTLGLWGLRWDDYRAHLDPIAPALEQVRAAGCQVIPSNQAVGVTDLSVPVRGPNGDAVAVLTCPYIDHPGEQATSLRDAALHSLIDLGARLSMT